ncbi:MAG: T9SS type A sorting domain-containing protein [Flavobacteriaceae bacterium]|nr:T9SS type A sorting domain-containing protein [Flavobacteriaceae bacterium]
MKKLLFLIIALLMYVLPTLVFGQNKGAKNDGVNTNLEHTNKNDLSRSLTRLGEEQIRRLVYNFQHASANFQSFDAVQNEAWNNRLMQNGNWEELGPFNNVTTTEGWSPGNGRVSSMAEDPNDPNTILIGTYFGGVWKTTDGGDSWIPLSDNLTDNDLGIESVAIDPSNPNIYYFGSIYRGLFRSSDAGATWENLGYIVPQQPSTVDFIQKILVHPNNGDVLYVALLDYETYDGVYKSIDGGETWNRILDTSSFLTDIKFKPDDPEVIFVSGRNFYRSPDSGDSWSILPGFNNEYKKFAISKNNPEVLYVLQSKLSQVSNRNIYDKLFKSTDGGLSFTSITHGSNNFLGYSVNADDQTSRVPDYMSIAINPDNPDEVHISGILTWRSLDGGNTFVCTSASSPQEAAALDIGYCHRDIEYMNFIGSTLYICSDGGIYKAEDTANLNVDYYVESNNNMGLSVVSSLDVAPSNDHKLIIGTWDNGSTIYDDVNGWTNWIGGNTRKVLNDFNDFDTNYGMTYNLGSTFLEWELFRTEDRGNSILQLGLPGQYYSTGLTQDPVNPNTIYLGSSSLYKSTNKGSSWSAISSDFSGTIKHVEVAPTDNQRIYVAAGNDRLYRTTNGGTTWSGNLLSYPVSLNVLYDVAVHPTKPNLIAVTGVDFDGLQVYVSSNGGNNWTNFRKNLPNSEGFALVWDDNGNDALYIGTNRTVYYIDNSRESWVGYNNNLPNIRITDFKINDVNNKIYAATLGRGVWISDKCNGCVLGVDEYDVNPVISLYPNPSNGIVTIRVMNPMVVDIRLFDTSGKLVSYLANKQVENEMVLDISKFSSGIYFVRIGCSEGTFTKRIIKE